MPPTHGDASTASASDLLVERAELLRQRPADDARLAEATNALRSMLDGPGAVRRVRLGNGAAEEKLARELAEMEPVNPLSGEADLRDRFDEDRRVFLLEHPNLPGRPMNIVWVALRSGLPDRLDDILDPGAPTTDATRADTAVFYSIWNAQPGLAGLGGGRDLLESVLGHLGDELPALETFVTLSPVPGLRRWLSAQGFPAQPPAAIGALCARYLAALSPEGRPLDPVARFHLGNGARLLRVCTDADRSALGMQRSWAAMANYRYAPEDRAANREALAAGHPALGESVRNLVSTG